MQLEEKNIKQNMERGKNAITNDINRINSIAVDWAAWDDSYNFVQDGNKAYIESNFLDPSTLVNLGVNFMVFYNISGHLIYGEGIDIKNKEKIKTPVIFQYDLSPNNILLKHTKKNSSIKGIIILPEGPTLIASRPITTSGHQGPIRGTLIVGRFLDSAEIERLANTTQLPLTSLFDDQNNSDFRSAIQLLSKEKPILIQPKSNDIIAGYILLNDIEGNPAVVIKAEMPREIHKHGDITMKYLILSIIVSGLVFGLVTLLLLEKNVLSRLAFLSSNVSAIGASSDHSMRVSMPGNDELSNLAKVINSMLEELEKAEDAKTKQLLLTEIYHRVKNNLQIVISLLNLQSQKTKDKNVIEIFKDSQNRIRSMALIHERLYKSKDLAGINFKEYIHDLSSNLFHSYGVNSGNVNLKIDIDDVILNLDTATPCGLIVTELVSNSLKHAFPKGRKGELLIRLISDNNEKFILIVRDNGIGFPENIDFRKTNTLGMQLVTSLVSQLKGTIELDRSNGTEFKITFKEKQAGVFENG